METQEVNSRLIRDGNRITKKTNRKGVSKEKKMITMNLILKNKITKRKKSQDDIL